MPTRRIAPGTPLQNVAPINQLIDQSGRNTLPKTVGRLNAVTGESGTVFIPERFSQCALFELADCLTYPATVTQCPYVEECERVSFDPDDDTYSESGGTTYTLYYPNALRDNAGEYIGLPRLKDGMRVWAAWNNQSGRWEIIAALEHWHYWGKTSAEVEANVAVTVDVYHVVGATLTDTGVDVDAYGPPVLGTDTINSDEDTIWVGITWFTDDQRFWITEAPC